MHRQRNPEVEQDDCEHSLAKVMEYVFNPSQEKAGTGRFDPDRLAFTWKVVSEAQQLDPSWDYHQAIDTSSPVMRWGSGAGFNKKPPPPPTPSTRGGGSILLFPTSDPR